MNIDTFAQKQTEQTEEQGWKWELAFALVSGLFILIGWLFSQQEESVLTSLLFLLAYGMGGYYKAKEGITETIQEKKLNVELLMVLAAIASALIGYWEEGAVLIFIFAVSGALESYTTNKSKKEISALMNLQPEEAWLLENGKETRVSVSTLEVGSQILVKSGERVPVDGIILQGKTSIDESAITGESIPVEKEEQAEVFAGTINGKGTIVVEMTKSNQESLFQKIITLVQQAEDEKTPSQQFIERFEGTYVKAVLVVVALMMFMPHYVVGWSWNETFYRAIVLLVVASPCAVVASIMPATLSAISNGARKGILFKGGVHIENVGSIQAIAFDKTGTLTKGKPEVTDFLLAPAFQSQKEIILSHVSSIEHYSNHPLAQAIVRYTQEQGISEWPQPSSIEDVSGWGVKANIEEMEWKVGKQAFMKGKEGFDQEQVDTLAKMGKTLVFIQRNQEVIGVFALRDQVRPEAKETIQQLQALGIQPIMLTGDHPHTAQAIAAEIGVNQYVAECLPDNKGKEIKRLKETYGNVAMVGDGINDAPALATAHVGIAMGEGTDVAMETADVVLLKNELTRIPQAIQLSKRMNRIVKQNLCFSIGVLLLLVLSNLLHGMALPFAVIGHEGSTILVILNGLRLLR